MASNGYVKTVLICLLHVAMSVLSFLFVKQTLNDFLEKRTYFQVDTTQMSGKDLPTYTFCFEHNNILVYGSHFIVEKLYNNTPTFIPLTMGENKFGIRTNSNGQKMHLYLKDIRVFSMKRNVGTYRQCFKIIPVEIDFYRFDAGGDSAGYAFRINFRKSPIPPNIQLYVTSEKNSYGAIFEKWYDGYVTPYKLKQGYIHFPLVSEVKEVQYLPGSCSVHSYYQCLASELAKESTCHNDDCLSFTLPSDSDEKDVATCNYYYDYLNLSTLSCKTNTLFSLHGNENICKGETAKLCVIHEYSVQDYVVESRTEFGQFVLILRVDSPKSPRNGIRISNPHKIIHKEQYQVDEFQMVGTVGGTLGLLIGFSFVTCLTQCTECLILVLFKLKNIRKQQQSRHIKMIYIL